jgi:hypothetical protein
VVRIIENGKIEIGKHARQDAHTGPVGHKVVRIHEGPPASATNLVLSLNVALVLEGDFRVQACLPTSFARIKHDGYRLNGDPGGRAQRLIPIW